jgi:hypothetical protein
MDRNGPAGTTESMEPTGHCALPAESYFHSLPGSERSSVNARRSLSSSVVVQGCSPRLVSVCRTCSMITRDKAQCDCQN